MSVRDNIGEIPTGVKSKVTAVRVSEPERKRDPLLEKRRGPRVTRRVTFAVGSTHLQALRRNQKELQDFVDGYIYSSDLLDQWIDIHSRIEQVNRDAPTEDDPDYWYGCWTELSVSLEKAEDSTENLSAMGIRSNEVISFRRALSNARASIPSADGEDDDALSQTLDQLNQAVAEMGFLIRFINTACRKDAKAQVDRLKKVVMNIFDRVQASGDIAQEEQKDRRSTESASAPAEERSVSERMEAKQLAKEIPRPPTNQMAEKVLGKLKGA